MKEVLLSIFKASEDRLKNPVFGTFFLSFIAFNWKPVSIFLLSDCQIEERIVLISNNYSAVQTLLLYPLLTVIFYNMILPYVMVLIEWMTSLSFKLRTQNHYKSKSLVLDEKKKVALAEAELEDIKSDYKEKADLNKQIRHLKDQIQGKDTYTEQLQQIMKRELDKNEELEKKVLERDDLVKNLNERIANVENSNSQYVKEYSNTPRESINDFVRNFLFINQAGKDKQAMAMVERFLTLGLITKTDLPDRKEHFMVTAKGLFFIRMAIENNLV